MRTDDSWLCRLTHLLIILVATFINPVLTPGDSVATLGSLLNPFENRSHLLVCHVLNLQKLTSQSINVCCCFLLCFPSFFTHETRTTRSNSFINTNNNVMIVKKEEDKDNGTATKTRQGGERTTRIGVSKTKFLVIMDAERVLLM